VLRLAIESTLVGSFLTGKAATWQLISIYCCGYKWVKLVLHYPMHLYGMHIYCTFTFTLSRKDSRIYSTHVTETTDRRNYKWHANIHTLHCHIPLSLYHVPEEVLPDSLCYLCVLAKTEFSHIQCLLLGTFAFLQCWNQLPESSVSIRNKTIVNVECLYLPECKTRFFP
jgi:hypothetical protein